MQLYQAHTLVTELFKKNPLVHTVTHENPTSIDLDKINVYPLVNIYLQDSQYGEVVQSFNFQISVWQQKDIIIDLNSDKESMGNTIDNFNECNRILDMAIVELRRNKSVVLFNTPFFNYIYDTGLNGIDGITTTFTIQVIAKNPIC